MVLILSFVLLWFLILLGLCLPGRERIDIKDTVCFDWHWQGCKLKVMPS